MWMYIQSAVVDGKLVSEKKTAAEKMLFNPGKLRKYYIAGEDGGKTHRKVRMKTFVKFRQIKRNPKDGRAENNHCIRYNI